MKNISLNLLFFIVALFFSSCSPDSEKPIEGSPEFVVKSFIESKDINERALYILTDEKFNVKENKLDKNFIPSKKFLIEIMIYIHGSEDTKFDRISNIKVKNIDCSKNPVEDETCKVNGTWSTATGNWRVNYDMQFKSGEWKIDWVKTQDFSFNEYKDRLIPKKSKKDNIKKDNIDDQTSLYKCKEINSKIAWNFSFTEAESEQWQQYKCSSLGFIKCTPLCRVKGECSNGCMDTYHYD